MMTVFFEVVVQTEAKTKSSNVAPGWASAPRPPPSCTGWPRPAPPGGTAAPSDPTPPSRAKSVPAGRGMSSQKRPGGPAGAGPSKRQNMAEDEDEDMGFDEEEMLAMEEEMADEAGQEDGPAPPDEEVAACLTKTQFAACAKQWTRPKVPPLENK